MALTDNSKQILTELEKNIDKALTKCGLVAEGHAKLKCPVDLGGLRNSITNKVKDKTMFVGSNAEYAAYVEFGTGKYYSGGRKTPWVYKDIKGNWHWTEGSKAQPYIKPSIAGHEKEYETIIKDTLKG